MRASGTANGGQTQYAERNPPALVLPVVYFGFAHLALFVALILLALRPDTVTGLLLAPHGLAIVHLVTLGWIALSIFGALHVVGPLALAMRPRNGAVDRLACGFALGGVVGIAWAFLVGSFNAVAIAGCVLLGSFAVLCVRVWTALVGGRAPSAIRAHIALSCANLLLASASGVFVALDRELGMLGGDHLGAVLAHAHLAALGFATLMFVGVGYRLLPMFLPAAPPPESRIWATALLLEVGVLGLAVSLWLVPATKPLFATVTACGLAVFFLSVLGMLRERKPPPVALRRPDPGMVQTLVALVYLLLSVVLGLYLAFTDTWRMDWMSLYGVCGLVGFLSQAILGVGMRLLPVFAWTGAWTASGYAHRPRSPHDMPARSLQVICVASWMMGVPLLGYGLARNLPGCVAAGAWLLLAGTVCGTVSSVRVLRHAFGLGAGR